MANRDGGPQVLAGRSLRRQAWRAAVIAGAGGIVAALAAQAAVPAAGGALVNAGSQAAAGHSGILTEVATGPAMGVAASQTTPRGALVGSPTRRLSFRPLAIHESPTNGLSASLNWSGYAGLTRSGTGVYAEWKVPAVAPTSSTHFSSTWTGVDGLESKQLLQAGTEEDSRTEPGAGSRYFAWMEELPAPAQEITEQNGQPAPVKPGDTMVVEIYPSSTSGTWDVAVEDRTEGWSTGLVPRSYAGRGQSAEWIEEAPTIVDRAHPHGTIAPLSNFGAAAFESTGLYDGGTLYSTAYTADNRMEMAVRSSDPLQVLSRPGTPSKPSSNGQHFSVYYATVPGQARPAAAVRSVHLTWGTPADVGGPPVVGYDIRVFRGGRLVGTIGTAGTRTNHTMTGLAAGGAYTFAVAARRFGDGTYVSRFSAPSRTARPRG